MRLWVPVLIVLLVLMDLAWNLSHFNSGLVDVLGLLGFTRSWVQLHAWPASPYFPAGYPLLLAIGGYLGNALAGGYVISAAGLATGLWALYRLVRELGGNRWLGLAALVLAWLLPAYRIIAGSPSVDPLYTGLALWFIAASVALWRFAAADRPVLKINELPPWAGWGLTIPVLILPLIRYHAIVLVLPVLLIVTIARPRLRPFLRWSWAALLAAFAFNYSSYYAAYHEPIPSVTAIQIRSGLEYRFGLAYPTPEHLYSDYVGFCRYARSNSVVADYGWPRLIEHTLKDWLFFLRRPPVALALVLALVLWFRRRLPVGAALLALWIPAYCLALSPAYYTARSAALPALTALGLALVLSARVLSGRRSWVGVIAAIALIGFGSWYASSYAQSIYAERYRYASYSLEVDRVVAEQGWHWTAVVTNDIRVIPLTNNPWCWPYLHTELSWTDDPAIKQPVLGLTRYREEQLADPPPDWQLEGLLLLHSHPRAAELQSILDNGPWEPCYEAEDYTVFRHIESTSPGGA